MSVKIITISMSNSLIFDAIALCTFVDGIIADPDIGESKKGDLAGFRVHKFRFYRQEYLIAYEAGDEYLLFVMIGPHENFYRDLKNYQREY